MKGEFLAMQTFVAVVEAGSFSAAGRLLGTGQSTVSRRIADLESELKVALLARTTREVKPTDAGARYYEAARAALASVELARAAVRPEAGVVSGAVKVGCSTLFADTWLAPRLGPWLSLHPSLRLDVHLRNAHVDLVSAGLDLAIRFGGPATSELKGRRLRTYRRIVLASPEWIERNGNPTSPQDLKDSRALMFGGHDALDWTLWRGDERATLRPTSSVGATAGGFLEILARHHVGPVLAPEWVMDHGSVDGDLVQILPEWKGSDMDLWVVWPNHAYQSVQTRAFLDWFIPEVLDQGRPS